MTGNAVCCACEARDQSRDGVATAPPTTPKNFRRLIASPGLENDRPEPDYRIEEKPRKAVRDGSYACRLGAWQLIGQIHAKHLRQPVGAGLRRHESEILAVATHQIDDAGMVDQILPAPLA